MIRWDNTSGQMGQFESLLTGLSADDRDQAVQVWTRDRARKVARAARRRDARRAQQVASLCWGIVSVTLILGASYAASLDIERPHVVGRVGGVQVIEDSASELRQDGGAR